jgi:hypothetical protein
MLAASMLWPKTYRAIRLREAASGLDALCQRQMRSKAPDRGIRPGSRATPKGSRNGPARPEAQGGVQRPLEWRRLDARGAEEFAAEEGGIHLRRFDEKLHRRSGRSQGQASRKVARHLGHAAVHAPTRTGAGRAAGVVGLTWTGPTLGPPLLFGGVRERITLLGLLAIQRGLAVLATRPQGAGRGGIGQAAGLLTIAGTPGQWLPCVGPTDAAGE